MNKELTLNNYNVIDLFCGCGGLSNGFEQAGYNVLLGIDNDAVALQTFLLNHKNSNVMNADLSKVNTFNEINEKIATKKIDVIVAGPPCQGFSLSGPRNFDDERNKLYLAVIEAVKRYKPRAFVIENVTGMATLYKGEVRDEVLKRLTKLGYNVKCEVLCAADFGVPQMRKRLFFVGIKKEYGVFEFPKPYLAPEQYITCSEAISDLPSRDSELGNDEDRYESEPKTEYQAKMRGDNDALYNHVATAHTQLVIDTIALVPDGCNYKSLPKGVGESRKFNEAWTRYASDKPSKTIDTGHRNHFHYEYNRVPTVRENARLQSFTDDFRFVGTKTQQNKQVGNAVPPLLGYAIALELEKYIRGEIDYAEQN